MAYLIVMMSFFVVGWTVHFWGMAYIWFLFLLGSGVWLLDVREERARAQSTSTRPGKVGVRERARVPRGPLLRERR